MTRDEIIRNSVIGGSIISGAVIGTTYSFFPHSDTNKIERQAIASFVVIGICAGSLVGSFLWKTFSSLRNYVYSDTIEAIESLEEENRALEAQIVSLSRWYNEKMAEKKVLLTALGRSDDDQYYVIDDNTPSEYICCITQEILRDPVYVEGDKRAYERASLQLWYEYSGGRCPINQSCSMPDPRTLPSSQHLKKQIDQYIQDKKQNKPIQNVSFRMNM